MPEAGGILGSATVAFVDYLLTAGPGPIPIERAASLMDNALHFLSRLRTERLSTAEAGLSAWELHITADPTEDSHGARVSRAISDVLDLRSLGEGPPQARWRIMDAAWTAEATRDPTSHLPEVITQIAASAGEAGFLDAEDRLSTALNS